MKHLILSAALMAALPCLSIAGENISYSVGDATFTGYQVIPDNPMGTVVIFHTFGGLTDFEKDRAQMFADAGYAAFAADLFGVETLPQTRDEKYALMTALIGDPALLQERISAAVVHANSLGSETVVVMGYSMGGTATMELARSNIGKELGVDGYGIFFGRVQDRLERVFEDDVAPIFVALGGTDHVIPTSDLAKLSEELEFVGASYHLEMLSGASHMFSVFGHSNYNQTADEHSWMDFLRFIEEL